MFRSAGFAWMLVCVMCCFNTARGDLINPASLNGSCSWSVIDMVGGSAAGTSVLTLPGSGMVNSAVIGAHVETTCSVTQSFAASSFAVSSVAYSGLGSASTEVSIAFATTQWSAFTLRAQADYAFMKGCSVALNGAKYTGSFDEYDPPKQWKGEVELSPAWMTRTGWLPPGTYTFDFAHAQSLHGRYRIPSTGAFTATLELQAVDPSQIPLPAAFWAGAVLAGMIWVRGKRRA